MTVMLTDSLPLIAAAPGGIKKLRELILELAVRGKLVPQDARDEPASELLTRIQGERSALVAQGKLKNLRASAAILGEEVLFEAPAGWVLTRFPEVASYRVGKTPPTKESQFWGNGEIPWVSISDMNHYGEVSSTERSVTMRAVDSVFKYPPAAAGSILMSFKLTVGKVSILTIDAYHNEAIISISPFGGIDKRYLFTILPAIARSGRSKNALMGDTLNSESLAALVIPVPPTAEQQRIVTKVDELMALCDRLESGQADSERAHQQLVTELLTTLTQSANPDEFTANWQRLSQHFDTLFTTEASIDALKQTILQLAVMGKLAPQDPGDESAREFLNRVQVDRSRAVLRGDIRGGSEQELGEFMGEQVFPLPRTWQWVRFSDIAENSKNALKAGPFGSALKKDMYVSEGYKIYGQEQVISGSEEIGDYYIDEKKYKQLESCAIKPGDLLISLVGTIGKVLILSEKCQPGIINPRLVKISLFEGVNRKYMAYLLASPLIRAELNSVSHGGTMDILNLGLLKGLCMPFPPCNEQGRIVARIEELISLCNTVTGHLADSRVAQELLASALVEKAVA